MTAAEIVATVVVRRAVHPLDKPEVPVGQVGPEVEVEGLVVVARRAAPPVVVTVHVLPAKVAGPVAVTAGRIGVRKVFVRRRPPRCLKSS